MINKKFVSIAALLAAIAAGTASAVEIDLNVLNGGNQYCVDINDGARVCNRTGTAGSVGSGTFPSFVATPGGQADQFQFYNTTGPTPNNNPDNVVGNGNGDNETLQLSQLGVSGGFVVFSLDINQTNSGEPERFLSLDEISIFLGDGSLTGYNSGTGALGGTSFLWSLTNGDWIKLNYDLAAGSGQDIDMYLLLPTSLFQGYALNTYLQLFSRFGGPVPGGYINNDGFEEWSYLRCVEGQTCLPPPCVPGTPGCGQQVPEPGTLALVGLGLLGLGLGRRRR